MKMKILIIILLIIYTPTVFASTLEVGNNVIEAVSTEYINEFTINISVPIDDNVANNILFVFDGSTVNDTTWFNMKNAITDCVNEILPYDDNDKNNNRVGFITFGISGHVKIPLTSDREEFIANLPETTNDLLLGRSSSNNETGLRVAKEYLNSLPEEEKKSPEHTIVIYMSDGAVNMSDKLNDFYSRSIDGSKYGGFVIIDYQISLLKDALVSLEENPNIGHIALFDEITTEIRNIYNTINNVDDSTTISLTDVINSISATDEYDTLMKNSILNFYEYIGYDITKSYSASEFETMMIKKDFIEDDTIEANFLDIFYVPMISFKYDKVECSNRAVEEGLRLKELSTIYTVAYNSGSSLSYDYANKIMNPHYTGSSTYTSNVDNHFSTELYFANINKITEAIKSLTLDVNKTNYKSLVMTGYTSKWVEPMDINDDGIFDEKDIVILKGYPIDSPPNIKVEKVSEEELENLENDSIASNSNGNVYKITWEVTEELKQWDQFKIAYKVKLDEQEDGFQYGVKYNANESFALNYTEIEINAEGQTEEKPVKVEISPPTIQYDKKIENPETSDNIYKDIIINAFSISGVLFTIYYIKKRNYI